MPDRSVPVGISSRHLHVSQVDLEVLFGKNHELVLKKNLSQPGQFAAEEVVNVIGLKGQINKVRILGPVRPETQIEISRTDSFVLGISPPLRESGSIAGSAAVVLEGPAGRIELKEGVIVAQRHLHLHTDEAARLGLKDKEWVSVRFDGPRGLIFNNILVRVNPNYAMDLHLDTDEANAAGLANGDQGSVL
jgi:putative phosphotransacetylase